jgi:hypothetical protein
MSGIISAFRRSGRFQAMDRSHQQQRKRGHPELVPVAWIAVLLAGWLLIIDWKMLPDLIGTTMAVLP